MAASPDDLFAFLDRLGIRMHGDASHPCSPSSNRRACAAIIPGAHTKNLFLRDKKGRSFSSPRSKTPR